MTRKRGTGRDKGKVFRGSSGDETSFLQSSSHKGVSFQQGGGNQSWSDGVRKRSGEMNGGSADYYMAPSGRGLRPTPSQATINTMDRVKIVLWRRPLQTLYFFVLELFVLTRIYSAKLWGHRKVVSLILVTALLMYIGYFTPGRHQALVKIFEKKLLWYAYWVGLGILSSVGLGTGLHTFVLYLGPHIASVTLAAYECKSLQFPEPPYPDEIVCPQDWNGSSVEGGGEGLEKLATTTAVSLLAIISKVKMESFMWGAGTALGELPPYFMARAARLSGAEPDDEEYQEYMEFIRLEKEYSGQPIEEESWGDQIKMKMERLLQSFGFFGILLCASIPNPLFDLAGITCGHFLIPFWKFFGATLIGKAVVKMMLQQTVVIMTFSERHMEKAIGLIKDIPKVGSVLQSLFQEFLKQQKLKLHRKPGEAHLVESSWVQFFYEGMVIVMVSYFLVSIINSFAQSYHKRQWKQTQECKQL